MNSGANMMPDAEKCGNAEDGFQRPNTIQDIHICIHNYTYIYDIHIHADTYTHTFVVVSSLFDTHLLADKEKK